MIAHGWRTTSKAARLWFSHQTANCRSRQSDSTPASAIRRRSDRPAVLCPARVCRRQEAGLVGEVKRSPAAERILAARRPRDSSLPRLIRVAAAAAGFTHRGG